jgi:hypothetical protein
MKNNLLIVNISLLSGLLSLTNFNNLKAMDLQMRSDRTTTEEPFRLDTEAALQDPIVKKLRFEMSKKGFYCMSCLSKSGEATMAFSDLDSFTLLCDEHHSEYHTRLTPIIAKIIRKKYK